MKPPRPSSKEGSTYAQRTPEMSIIVPPTAQQRRIVPRSGPSAMHAATAASTPTGLRKPSRQSVQPRGVKRYGSRALSW